MAVGNNVGVARWIMNVADQARATTPEAKHAVIERIFRAWLAEHRANRWRPKSRRAAKVAL